MIERQVHEPPPLTARRPAMTAALENVNEILARRCTAAGLLIEDISEKGETAVAALMPAIDTVLPVLVDDPYALRIMAECLRSYGDLCENYATAREAADV